jgi:hypothetical protein
VAKLAHDLYCATINSLVWLLSFLRLFWAAGQVSLFFHALEWYRRPAQMASV